MNARVIRPADFADIPHIAAIYRHAVATSSATFETEPVGEAEMTQRYVALVAANYPYLVAEVDDEIAGYAYAGPFRLRQAFFATVEDSVYVAPGRERSGIGRALLAELIVAGTARGFRQMIALIGGSDNAASIGLHRATGFAGAGTLPAIGFKHGRWVDVVLMQRALGTGANTLPG